MYYLGIDGGGSKTCLAVVNESGNLIAYHVGGPSNPTSVHIETINEMLDGLFEKVKNQGVNFSEIKGICAGFAGMESSQLKGELETFLSSKFHQNTQVELCNDAITALYSGTNGQPGIVNIAGTGSITFGVTDERKVVRTGGWGYLLEHSGSGYGIGKAAIHKVFDSYDGLIGKTELTDRVLSRFCVGSPPELIPFIYGHPDSRMKIASVCEDVFQLMRKGDRLSTQIIETAASDISLSIRNLITRYFNKKNEIKVVLAGSVFKSSDVMLPIMRKHLPQEVDFILPPSPPIAGAIIQSYQMVNGPCPNTFTNNLHQSLATEV
ncbi:N-acetylglucosamine kinase [Pseudalkalibacillus berkeleyi]|uniref:ATPase BadF/BadG/BcrA/BcrD type domain-containing protein n=1 Tax=Pseudalkalibacillus berkeleyi TaxID=1069813 RepID=A0ABS9H289_9BACL|nr:BadF/BadG/BcrA/BcrD ATPase family protein [Pseudalkalibacillus berkeleyi]MCF6137770.1 hypothetical protein [Pseudalkalibacillus berkeleyi]